MGSDSNTVSDGDFDLNGFLTTTAEAVERFADEVLPPEDKMPAVLGEAMRYSFFAGGKRIRPALGFAAAEAVGAEGVTALPFVTAIEMIHTYSLIHDDLPAMDDDELRRGMPTSHVKFGEATAILAGDALLTDAFAVMLDERVVGALGAAKALRCALEVARAAGSDGMAAGQTLDIISQGRVLELPTLEFLHTRKTGALIRASVLVGAISGGADAKQERALTLFADRVGLAFQVADDILDVEGTTEAMGKPTGSDEGHDKATYPSLLGMSESKKHLEQLTDEAIGHALTFGERGRALVALARFIANRDH